jgi:hypothetical protein
MSYSIQSPIGDLLDNEVAKNIVEQHLPGISSHPQISMARSMSLVAVAPFSGNKITSEALSKIDVALKALK